MICSTLSQVITLKTGHAIFDPMSAGCVVLGVQAPKSSDWVFVGAGVVDFHCCFSSTSQCLVCDGITTDIY